MEASILSNVILQKIETVIRNQNAAAVGNGTHLGGIYEVRLLLDSCDDDCTVREISSLLASTEAPELLTQVLAHVFSINNETPMGTVPSASPEYSDSSMDQSPVSFHKLPESFVVTVDCCLSIFAKLAVSNIFLEAVGKTDLPKYAVKILNTFIENKLLVATNLRPLLTSLTLLDKIYKTEGVPKPSGNDGMVMALMNVYMNFEFQIEDLVLLVKSISLMVTSQIISEDNYVFLLAEDSSIDFLLDILRKCFLTKQKYPNYKGIYALDLAKALENFAAIEGLREKMLDSGAIELLVTLMQEGHETDGANAIKAINCLLDRKDSGSIESPILLNGIQGSRPANSGYLGDSSIHLEASQPLQLNTVDKDRLSHLYSKASTECKSSDRQDGSDVNGECQTLVKSTINNGQTGAKILDEEGQQSSVGVKEECQQGTGTVANHKKAGEQSKVISCTEDKQTQNENQAEAASASEPSPCQGRSENALSVMSDELKEVFNSLAHDMNLEDKEVLQSWDPSTTKQVESGDDKRVLEDATPNAQSSKREFRVISSQGFQLQVHKSDHLSGSELSFIHDQIVAEGFHNLYDEKTSGLLNEILSEEKLYENKLFNFFDTWPMQLSFNLRRCGSIERNLRVVPAQNLPEMAIPVTHLQPELDYHLVLKRFTFWNIPQFINSKYPGFTFVGPWQKIPTELEDLVHFFTKTRNIVAETAHDKSKSVSDTKSGNEEENFVFLLSARKLKDFLLSFTWSKFLPMVLFHQQLLAEGKSTDAKSLIKNDVTILKPPEENGPAVSLIQTYCNLSVDYVLAVRFIQWPSCASEWVIRERQSWPTHGIVDEVVKTGCHLVPKQPPSLPEVHTDYGLYWQFSFAAAENTLLNLLNKDIPVLADCLRMLKFVCALHLDRPELLKSYHLQTVTLWAAERCPITHWRKDNFLGHLLDLLDDLMHYLINFNLPNYFISNQNLFGNFSNDFLIDVAQRVSKIRKNPGKYLHASHDPAKFGLYVV